MISGLAYESQSLSDNGDDDDLDADINESNNGASCRGVLLTIAALGSQSAAFHDLISKIIDPS